MKKKIFFSDKIKNIKTLSDLFLKIKQLINLLLTFPRGGFARHTVDLFMKNISLKYNNIKMLDVGAGNKPYKNLFKNCLYESCEHETIHKETNISEDDHTFYCDITKEIPRTDNCYDLIICNEVLEHINEPSSALNEFNRILKPGGHLVITAPQCHGLHQEPHNYFNYLSHGLEYLLKKSNFSGITITPLGGSYHLLGKVLSNCINIFFDRFNKFFKVLFYPIEVLVKIIFYPIFILLFYFDFFDKNKKWTINYGCFCKKL
jgi:SAM-dependent methyltransferase